MCRTYKTHGITTKIRLCYKYGEYKGLIIRLLNEDPSRLLRNGHYHDPAGYIKQKNSTRTPHARCEHGVLLPHEGMIPPGKPYASQHWCYECERKKWEPKV